MHRSGAQTSRPVHSSQGGVHPRLAKTLQRHLEASWRKPRQEVDCAALALLDEALATHEGPLVLDSFCGTGESTAYLASRYPQALVVGVDKSAARLARHRQQGDYLLLQAHCEAVWRHLVGRGRTLALHCIFYPNPWPKPAHLARRVHGHPAFPLLLALAGALELRSNWQLYLEEFGAALHLAGHPAGVCTLPAGTSPISAFERKYRASGHTLWQLTAQLKATPGMGYASDPVKETAP